MVLLPPYLKDRRTTSRTFAGGGLGSALSPGSAQRFLPLQQARPGYSTGRVTAPTGLRSGQVAPVAVPSAPSNVVQLRPDVEPAAPTPVSAVPQPVIGAPASSGLGVPSSKAAARERRRQVLIGLTALAFVTLLLALAVGGRLIAVHVGVDAVMLGYVILLVRHRQLEAEKASKIEPIRPPVTEQAPAAVQAAPSYLLRSGT